MGLQEYYRKRDFKKTREPKGRVYDQSANPVFVVQEHHASRLHYDLRLELDGTLKSWAVPKGPSTDPEVKRLAVQTEDHPLEYATFEGTIPEGEYGGGEMFIWDRGHWVPPENASKKLQKGYLSFELKGERLKGKWALIRTRSQGKQQQWLLVKKQDEEAYSPTSVGEPPPKFIEPQLAQLVDVPPNGPEWIHEIKYDGYRTITRVNNGSVQMLTRSGLDWTHKYKNLADEFKKWPIVSAVLDGEVVFVDPDGKTNFQALQGALKYGHSQQLQYYVFDLLFLNGEDLRDLPLLERKVFLCELMEAVASRNLLYSDHFDQNSDKTLKAACNMNLEGLVSKRIDLPYSSGRSFEWQKSKCTARQELVIGGYTSSDSHSRDFRSLLLGYYDGKEFIYAGKVGTGFGKKNFPQIFAELERHQSKTSPFVRNLPKERNVHWTKPKIVAEIEFTGWTEGGHLRHPSFKGLRKDKDPKDVRREDALGEEVASSQVKLTHPERILYTKTKTSKRQVFDYYERAYELMEPYISGRPLSLVRCPNETTANCFVQKHIINGIGSDQEIEYGGKTRRILKCETREDLLTFVQMGAVEFHNWRATFHEVAHPSEIIFDLDPESKKQWTTVVDIGFEIREQLEQLELQSFLKLTGGKGIHIHVPIAPKYTWDQVKEFSKGLMSILVEKHPTRLTTNSSKAKRKGKIFLDYLRNGFGATAIAPYSLRARERPTVAVPIPWEDLSHSTDPQEYEMGDFDDFPSEVWSNYTHLQQKLAIFEQPEAR